MQNQTLLRIKNFFKQERFEAVLKVQFPEIEELSILLNNKEEYIVFAMNHLDAIYEQNKDNNLFFISRSDLTTYVRTFSNRFYLSSGFSIDKCRAELNDICELTQRLRGYINETFSIDDLI